MGKLLDELYAVVAVCLITMIEIAVTVALYIAMIVCGWFVLGWLARWLLGI